MWYNAYEQSPEVAPRAGEKKMRKAIVVLSILWALFANAHAQNAKPEAAGIATVTVPTTTATPEPEWAGQVFWLADGKLMPLERQTARQVTKTRGFGLGGGSLAFVYKGAKSPIEIPPDAKFVVRLEGSKDPATQITLHSLQQEGEERKVILVRVGSMLRGFRGSSGGDGQDLIFAPYGGNSAKFASVSPLSPGQYALRTAETSYLFSVE